jgi:hypothetical protein
MKTPEEIREQIKFAKDQLSNARDQYSKLHQIDMLSQEGNMLQELINQVKGEIKALEWVLGNEQ